jgi:cytochrome c551/c552
MKPLSVLFLATAALPAADPPAQVFQMNCAACHAVDQMIVGPSLVEIAGIYRENADDFVKWCIAPQHKREGAIEMPSMAHLGEPTLRELHKYILGQAVGKKEQKKADNDPFGVPVSLVRRPQVQRIFLPEASPAAIAVALPGDLSFCFDASECRLRYVWKGGFIDAWPYWKGNGSSQAKLTGEVVYREARFPLTWPLAGEEKPPKFLGYRVGKDGLPSFRYQRGGVTWKETIKPLPDGAGIERHFELDAGKAMTLAAEKVSVTSTIGSSDIPTSTKSFTLTFRWK